MPLELLLVMVIGGVGGIALLLHILGLSKRRSLADSDSIRAEWRRHFPEDAVTATHPSSDDLAALVETPDGSGLLWVMGADCTARRLSGASSEEDTNGITFRFHDFGAPKVRVTLDEVLRAEWRAVIMNGQAA